MVELCCSRACIVELCCSRAYIVELWCIMWVGQYLVLAIYVEQLKYNYVEVSCIC